MADRTPVLEPVIRKVFTPSVEYQSYGAPANGGDFPDFIFACDADEHQPEAIFPRLRWGGQFVFASSSAQAVQKTAGRFAEYGFHLETPADIVKDGWRLFPLLRRKVHYFSARKTLHVPLGGITDRFTFQVELSVEREKHNGRNVVTKRVPSVDWVLNRLRNRSNKEISELPEEELRRRAAVLIRNILPIFLTREVGIMRRLQERLPTQYRHRVPYTVRCEKDERGLVTLLQVNWLRNGGESISQMEFAQQSAELLHAVHDKAGVAHLDLRLDNMVVTRDGVGFIDFGNSVHDDEDFSGTSALSKVINDLMRTTQVQKTLYKAIQSGSVTAPYFTKALWKPDKAIDLFYLVLQFTAPHDNPDLKDLIRFTPNSDEDYELHKLTGRLFMPDKLEPGKVYTAGHVCNALKKLAQRLA